MNKPTAPLTEQEMDRLDQFLLDRIDDDAVTDNLDEGVLDMTELDGLFTAIVSGPTMVPPSQWLAAVWGDFDPVWESENEFEAIFSLMIRHMNGIAYTFMEQPEYFEPLFLAREVDNKTYTIVDEWCEGYRRGVSLTQDNWDSGGNLMSILLIPIYAFTAASNWPGHEVSDEERVSLHEAIVQNAREIHAHWLSQRGEEVAANQPIRRTTPQVGRNDPCPCGSGKKYKKCCLH